MYWVDDRHITCYDEGFTFGVKKALQWGWSLLWSLCMSLSLSQSTQLFLNGLVNLHLIAGFLACPHLVEGEPEEQVGGVVVISRIENI